MTERPIHELESELRSVGREVIYPETPDLRAAVVARIRQAPTPVARTGRSRLRLALVAVSLMVVALAATVGLSPSARRAVADWIGVDGIRITFGDEPTTDPVGGELDLGSPATPEEAREAVSFEIGIPQALGEPDAYFIRRYVEGGEVSLVWQPAPGLPESEHTGVGAVLTQFLGAAQPESLKKTAATGTRVTFVPVNGREGFFIEGAPHVFVRGPSGGERVIAPRLAGNTLLWAVGGITYRLEAEIGLQRAREIAESIPD